MKSLKDKYFDAVLSLTHRLSYQVSQENIAQTALATAVESLGFDGGAIYLVREEQKKVYLLKALGSEDPKYLKSIAEFSIGEAIVGKVAARNKAVYVPDLSQHPLARPETKASPWKSFYIFPLSARGKAIGVMALGYQKHHLLTSEDMECLDAIGNLIGMAMDRSRFILEQQHLTMQQTLLSAIEGILVRQADVAKAGEEILKILRDVFGYTYLVFAWREKEEVLRILSQLGYEGEDLPEIIPPHKGITWRAVHTKKIQIVENVHQDPDYIQIRKDVVSELAVPILNEEGEAIGVINIEKPHTPGFSNQEVSLMRSIANQLAVAIRDFQHLQERDRYYTLLQEGYSKIIKVINEAIEKLIPHYKGHSNRVAFYAEMVAQGVDSSKSTRKKLKESALFHDIGSIFISPEILNKPGPLTAEERGIIQEHPRWGAEILERFPGYEKDVAPWVLYHHENWDGSGYPEGRKGEDIPLEARILRLAETWDALLSRRTYRDALSKERAIEVLKEEKGRSLDPNLVDVFLKKLQYNNG